MVLNAQENRTENIENRLFVGVGKYELGKLFSKLKLKQVLREIFNFTFYISRERKSTILQSFKILTF